MKTSRWLTAFWMLVLALPLLILGIIREERLSHELTTARTAARSKARDLLLEAQSLALPKDGIGSILRLFQQRAENIAWNTAESDDSKRRKLTRLYRMLLKPWLPPHALRWQLNPDIDPAGRHRLQVAQGRSFPARFAERFLAYRWFGNPDEELLGAQLGKITGCPGDIDRQDHNKNEKVQSFLGRDVMNGLFWRSRPQSGMIAWLDLAESDPNLGMRIAAAQTKEPGCGLLFIDESGTPIVGGGEWSAGGKRLVDRLLKLGGGRLPSIAVVGRRLAVTGPLSSGMSGRIIMTVAWPAGKGLDLKRHSRVLLACLALLAGFILLSAATFIGRRATVGWMLLGACLGLVLVPASASWMIVRRSVAEYSRIELKNVVDHLHKDLTNLDNGGMALHATLVSRLLSASRNPETYTALASTSTSGMRNALRGIIDQGRLPSIYPQGKRPEILLGVSPDDKLGLICNKSKMAPVMPENERPILDVFGPLAKKIRDGIKYSGKEQAPETPQSGARLIRESIKSDILYDLYLGIIGIDAMIAQITFPEELNEVKTSFVRVFTIGLRVFRERRFPTEWLLFWVWDDWMEAAHVNRIFLERFGSRTDAGRKKEAVYGLESPDSEPAAPEIWILSGMADLMFSEWVAPWVESPPTLQRAIERARNSGVLQTGRDMSAPGRPVYEAFPGINLPRYILAGQVETNPIERRAFWIQLAGNALAAGLVIAALTLAWHGRGRLLIPLERLRLAMVEISSGHFETRIPADRSDEFGTLAVAFNSMARALQEAAILGRFVSGTVRRAVRERRADESGRGERREVTVLFSCLFHFDRLCSENDPGKIFHALGEHLGALNAELQAFSAGAEIDKVIGDKILVVFDHERLGGKEAAAAAAMSVVNGVRLRLHTAGIEIAMGINTGLVISGILGATSVRLDHTVIGDPVNLASRLALLAHMTEGTRTVLSGAFLDACGNSLKTEKLPFRRVKGKTQEVEAYLLLDDVCKKHA